MILKETPEKIQIAGADSTKNSNYKRMDMYMWTGFLHSKHLVNVITLGVDFIDMIKGSTTCNLPCPSRDNEITHRLDSMVQFCCTVIRCECSCKSHIVRNIHYIYICLYCLYD